MSSRIIAKPSNRSCRARGLYLPQVDARAGVGPEWSDNATTRTRRPRSDFIRETRKEMQLTLTQRLFDGWEASSEVERQTARGRSAARRVAETAETVALDAIEAHVDVVRQRALLMLAQGNVDTHRAILDRVRRRTAGGAAPGADMEQVQARLDAAVATMIETKGALQDAEHRYFFVVNQRPGIALAAVQMPMATLPRMIDEAIERARASNLTLKVTESDVVAAEKEISSAESAFYPKLNLELGMSRNRDIDGARGEDNDASALMVMRWNLYRGGVDQAQRRVALGRMSQAMSQRQVALRNAEEEARRSWTQLQITNERLPSLDGARNQNRAVRDAYATQFFNRGERSLIDVLNAENELFVSNGRVASAEHTRVFAAYRLLAAMGELTSTLGLETPPEADEKRRTVVPQDPRAKPPR
jgi:adhesin transport system outer membrane protein